MELKSLWMRVFLLFALALAVTSAPIDRFTALSVRQGAPANTTANVPAPAQDNANPEDEGAALELEPTQEERDDPEFFDPDTLFKRKGGKGIGGLLSGLFGKKKGSSSAATPPPPPPPPPAPKPDAPKVNPSPPPPPVPAPAPAPKPASPPPGSSKPAPANNGKKAGTKNPNKGKKPPLPVPTISNSRKNNLKDVDVMFFTGTGGPEGTAKAKAFARKNNLKIIDDGFTPGIISNANQFAGDKAEKQKFFETASENFAKAIPGNTKGKVFVAFPGNEPPAKGIFSRLEAPALKNNGHTSLIRLDFDKLDTIDPKTATDTFTLP